MSQPGKKTESPRASSWRNTLVSYLTPVAQGSAPFISTFLMIHLAAPMVANIGGSGLSTQVMLLGREYYQTSFGERYLVIAPICIHAISSTLKRLISPRPPRPSNSILSMTGYAIMGFWLPVHYLLHRLTPSNPSLPIASLSPSELDYEFVKTGLRDWPIRNWLGYVVLTIATALHASQGAHLILHSLAAGLKTGWKGLSRKTHRNIALAAVVPVLTGLAVLSREPAYAFAVNVQRHREVFLQSPLFRF